MMQIGERMKAYRKMRGLSIQRLADAYDISVDEYLGRRTKQVNLESFTTEELLGEIKRRLDGKVS